MDIWMAGALMGRTNEGIFMRFLGIFKKKMVNYKII